MAKTKKRRAKPALRAERGATGTYVYDEASDRVVKISDRIPSVSAKGKAKASAAVGPCGRSQCGGGSCAGGFDA